MLPPTSLLLIPLLLLSTTPSVLATPFSSWLRSRTGSNVANPNTFRTGVGPDGKRVNPYARIPEANAAATRVGPEKRQATGGTTNPCTGGCCSTMQTAPPPSSRRRNNPYPGFTGEVLEPENAVRFIMSPWGNYEHTNGTWVYDHIYARDTKRILETAAKRGMVGRFFAETLGANLLTMIPRPIMIRKLIDILQYSGGLFTASPNTGIRTEDILPTLELLMAQPGFDGFSLHGYTYPKMVVEETLEVLRGMKGEIGGEEAYEVADQREDELERRMMEKANGGGRGGEGGR